MIDLRRFLAEHVGRQGSFRLDVAEGAALIARLDAERSRADAAEAERDAAVARADKEADADRDFRTAIWSIIDRHGLNDVPSDELGAIARLVKLAARALPEPRLMRTVEEVEALPAGEYRVLPTWNRREWTIGRRHRTRTWTLLVDMGSSGVMDGHLVGAWISGPLPDLPTPTAAQEAANG